LALVLAVAIMAATLNLSHKKGTDIYNDDASIADIFGEELKGRMLLEAVWNTYQATCPNNVCFKS